MDNLVKIIEALVKVNKGTMKKEALKKRFGIGAKKYDEIRLNAIKSHHLIRPLDIYSQEEINKITEGNKELEEIFTTKAREVETYNEQVKKEREKKVKTLEKPSYPYSSIYRLFTRLKLKLEKEGKVLEDFITQEGVIEDIVKLRIGVISKEDFYHKYLLIPSDFYHLMCVLFFENRNKEFLIFPLDELSRIYKDHPSFVMEQKKELGITKKSEVKLELLNNPNIKKEDLIQEFINAVSDEKALISLIDKYNLSYFLFNEYREFFVKHEGIKPTKLYKDIEIERVKWLKSISDKLGEVRNGYTKESIYFEDDEFAIFSTNGKNQKIREFQFQSKGAKAMPKKTKESDSIQEGVTNQSQKEGVNNMPKKTKSTQEGAKDMKSPKLNGILTINQDKEIQTTMPSDTKEILNKSGIETKEDMPKEDKSKNDDKSKAKEKTKKDSESKVGRPAFENPNSRKTSKIMIYTTQDKKDKISQYVKKLTDSGDISGGYSEFILKVVLAYIDNKSDPFNK